MRSYDYANRIGVEEITWERFVIWLAAGMVIYFAYGRRKSRLARV